MRNTRRRMGLRRTPGGATWRVFRASETHGDAAIPPDVGLAPARGSPLHRGILGLGRVVTFHPYAWKRNGPPQI